LTLDNAKACLLVRGGLVVAAADKIIVGDLFQPIDGLGRRP
jgi:hypothetical protein